MLFGYVSSVPLQLEYDIIAMEDEFYEWKDILMHYNKNIDIYTDDVNNNLLAAYDF